MAEDLKKTNMKVLTNNLAFNANLIQQKAFGELVAPQNNDLYFFIPCYQRGYRWGKEQIYDLCNDLLDFALKKEQEAIDRVQNKSFYCLQPIIVIPKKFEIKGHGIVEGYEVVDGQQRLTSLFVLYRFLVNRLLRDLGEPGIKGNVVNSNNVVLNNYSTKLYHIHYETRPDDFETIERIGYDDLRKADISDIDIAHICNAYQYMSQWVNDEKGAKGVMSRYPKTKINNPMSILNAIINLLHYKADSEDGSVQVIWYELDNTKDAVKEFIKENTGKIKLTDTELIKGLFMQKRNWDKSVSTLQQLSIGKDWELIENTLHRNDFWAFLSNNIHEEDNRIKIVFEYIYQKNNCGIPVPKDKPNALFRYYSDYFEAKHNMTGLWEEVKECFQAMQNWFNDPYIYNLVGLLSKQGKSLYDIISVYNLNNIITTDDFKWKLKEVIKDSLVTPIVNDDTDSFFPNRYFSLFYGKNNVEIKNLLLFVNVRLLCLQLDKARKDIEASDKQSDKDRTEQDLMNHIYKFPYDVLDSFSWDIEHIDSATTNTLKKADDKLLWINSAIGSLGDKITSDTIYNTLWAKYEKEPNNQNDNLAEIIKRIKHLANDDNEESEEKKNWIGNLTLLDCGTNRSYGNALFIKKHSMIDLRAQNGIFIPICTKNVFDKNLNGCTKGQWQWDWNDKVQYHKYLLEQYDDFVKEITEHNDGNGNSEQENI